MSRYLLIFLIACGGGGSITPPLDGAPDAPPDAAAAIDAPPDAPSTDPAILAVVTDADAAEIRQDAVAHLVLTGRNLEGASSVTIGTTAATIDSASATEARVTLLVPSIIGPQPVTLVATAGTVTKPAAIVVTPFIVAPGGGGGLGTYGSPLGLCDLNSDPPQPGDTVELQAGTHEAGCMVMLSTGVTITGAPGETVIVRGTADTAFGFGVFGGPEAATTTLRDLTFEEPLLANTIDLAAGALLVQRVRDAGGIGTWGQSATLDHYTFVGAGPAVDTSGDTAGVTVTDSTIQCTSGTGILAHDGGQVALDGVTIMDCATGLWAEGSPTTSAGASVTDCDFVDNFIGIRATFARASISGTTIRDDETTTIASSIGVWADAGTVDITTTTISDQDSTGLLVTSPNPNDAIHSSQVIVNGVEIVRGRVGLECDNLDNHVTLRNSTIRDQTSAAISWWALDSRGDFGQAGDPGHNVLSVVSGFVLDDHRSTESLFYRYLYANGTTLNGVSFDGQTIEGPAELAPYYRSSSGDSGLQF